MWFARDEADGQMSRVLLRARDDEVAPGGALGSVRFQRYKVKGDGAAWEVPRRRRPEDALFAGAAGAFHAPMSPHHDPSHRLHLPPPHTHPTQFKWGAPSTNACPPPLWAPPSFCSPRPPSCP
jgi:hypothetical protein